MIYEIPPLFPRGPTRCKYEILNLVFHVFSSTSDI